MTPSQTTLQRAVMTAAHHDFTKGLNTYAFYKVSNHTVGEDLVQDTFIKTWAYLVKGGKIETMKAFLYHVLNNLIVDEYRKHKTSSLDVMLDNGFEPRVNETQQTIAIADGKRAMLLIQKLPNMYQRIMHLRFADDLSIKEISIITEKSVNTVSVQIHRGLEKLKLLYAPV